MKVALYIGDHAKDALLVRVGCALTRLVQKGAYGRVSHCEAIHAEHSDGTVDIASASLREGGVRTKTTALTAGNWMVVDVPSWDTQRSITWFVEHNGLRYDLRGALATVLPGHPQAGRWFCNAAVGASVGLVEPASFGTNHFAAIALTLGTDITEQFFAERMEILKRG